MARSTALRRFATPALLGVGLALSLVSYRAHADEAPAGAAPPAHVDGIAGGEVKACDPECDRQAESIARSVMSPFCPGRTLSSCPNAAEWRADIRRWVAEGVDAPEIRKRLAARVPNQDLTGAPPNRLGWVLPMALGTSALGLLIFLLRYLIKPGAAPEPKAPAKTDATGPAQAQSKDWESRLEEELETLEN